MVSMSEPFDFSEPMRRLDFQTRHILAGFAPPMVTLYDQFGRPVYVPSSQKKIGDSIKVQRPHTYGDQRRSSLVRWEAQEGEPFECEPLG